MFPNPDPVLRHLDVTHIPEEWAALPTQERSMRGRYALLGICAGITPELAWVYALDSSPAATREIEGVILPLTDEQMEHLVSVAPARRPSRSAASDRRRAGARS
jgi:hypothetical protein